MFFPCVFVLHSPPTKILQPGLVESADSKNMILLNTNSKKSDCSLHTVIALPTIPLQVEQFRIEAINQFSG